MSQAENASSTTASRRDALLGLTVAAVASVPIINAVVGSSFDPHDYLARMRAMGSRFYVSRNTTTGQEGLCELYPDAGWDDAQQKEMLDLCRALHDCPNGRQRVRAVLIDEGHLVLHQ